jgi:hypothetical protein
VSDTLNTGVQRVTATGHLAGTSCHESVATKKNTTVTSLHNLHIDGRLRRPPLVTSGALYLLAWGPLVLLVEQTRWAWELRLRRGHIERFRVSVEGKGIMISIPFRCTAATTLRLWVAVIGLAVASSSMTSANAAVTFSGTAAGNGAGQTNSATVTFALSISGTTTDLIVTLTNLGTYKPNDPPDILTGVFFTIPGDPTLTKISALLAAGSVGVENGANLTVPGGVVGGSWAYVAGLTGTPGSANEGIAAAGFGLFGSGNVFPGAMLPGDGSAPGGIGGGLTTLVDDGSQYNGGTSGRPYIKNSAVFTLASVPASFTLSDISAVSFAYGSAPDQTFSAPPVVVVPEPGPIVLAGVGIVFVALLGRKRR